jgi:hypothetical protein
MAYIRTLWQDIKDALAVFRFLRRADHTQRRDALPF